MNRKKFFDASDDGINMFTPNQNDDKYHLVFSNKKSKQLIGSTSNDSFISQELQDLPLF